jgi:hypothetical protein
MDFLFVVEILGTLFLGVTVILAVQSLAFGRRAIVEVTRSTAPGLVLAADVLSALLLGSGVLILLFVPTLYWFIHGDSERYLWVIRGPSPFNQFGSGPYQLWPGISLLVAGSGMIVSGLAVRKIFWRALGR